MTKRVFTADLDHAEQVINSHYAEHTAGHHITPEQMVDVVVAFGHVAKVIVEYGTALEALPGALTPAEQKEATDYLQDLTTKSGELMETFDEIQQAAIQAAGHHKIKEMYH